MNSPTDEQDEPPDHGDVDPIDRDAAVIDARSEDAPEQIERLIEHAGSLGRDASQKIESDVDDEPEILPG